MREIATEVRQEAIRTNTLSVGLHGTPTKDFPKTHFNNILYYTHATLYISRIYFRHNALCITSVLVSDQSHTSTLFLIQKTPWSESASELKRPRDHRLPANLVPTFADTRCYVVSVTNPYGRNLGFLDRSRYFFF
jgi:hypothetical protein